jgi:Asp-tRNA(Asn)/Glu-tRNA(Gln) amidotransferase A subunit family amidase
MPLEPEHGELVSRLLVEHAVTRSVRDSARLLDHTHGALPGEPYPAPAPAAGSFEQALRSPLRRLRIALSTETLTGGAPHPECAAAAERAARLCVELGHEVVQDGPNLDGPALVDAWFGLWTEVMMSLALQAQAAAGRPLRAEELEPRTWSWYGAGRRRTAAEHLESLRTIQDGARAVAELLTKYDAWLTPTLGLPAIPVGAFDAGSGDTVDVERYIAFSPYTRMANMTGCPGMSVPVHWSADGVPVGAHFLGRMWDEATLLGLAHQLEQAAPWRDRRPPVRVGE